MAKFDYDFKCFRMLRTQMFGLHYNMYPFFFTFRRVRTFAAVYCLSDEEREERPELKYVLFRLIFMKRENLDQSLECFINVNGITHYERSAFRDFFEIDGNGGNDFMFSLCADLVTCCPNHVIPVTDAELERAERYSLCKTLKLNPERCYRKSIIRLTDKKRNPNTYQLALKLFPHAAIQYANDDSVTYGFTDNPEAEVSEEVAIANFIARETKRAKKSHLV